MYSITYDITETDNNVLEKEKKVAKGISKCEIKKTLQNAMYKNCLFGETTTINSMKWIRCVNHELYVNIINKKGLCSFDDKRYWKNHIESYAFEHYKIYSPTKVKHHLTCFNNIFSNNELISNRFAVFVTCTHILTYLPVKQVVDRFLFVYMTGCVKSHVYFSTFVFANES